LLIEDGGFFQLLLVNVLLFVYLLRKTRWLEELSKAECWLGLVVVFGLFRIFSTLDPFKDLSASQLQHAFLWFSLPKFLFLLYKMYLLAVLVKIPVVLVYNFASLSGKLRISSWFQSTAPQFAQLVILVLIFYHLVAGWQAEKVRRGMLHQMEQLAAGAREPPVPVFKVRAQVYGPARLSIEGHRPVTVSSDLPDNGVMVIPRTGEAARDGANDYFLFSSSEDDDGRMFYFVRLDSTFLRRVSRSTSPFAASLLLAYPYTPPAWEAFLYKLSPGQDRQELRIFPFGFKVPDNAQALAAPFQVQEESDRAWVQRLNDRFATHLQFIVGRVLAPVLGPDGASRAFFSFDIVLIPDISIFTRTLLSYLVLLGLLYALVNMLVIRRMVKFGSEIHRSIVQRFNQLKAGIREITAGNLDYKVKVEGKDEFVELAGHFNRMGERLKASIAEAREKERLKHELTIARNVQLGLLPHDLPQVAGFKIAATLKTANEVGGDFYDFLPVGRDRYLFTVGDVSGKGTSAAFYMAQCVSLIRYSNQFSDEPEKILQHLNRYFSAHSSDREIFVTAVVGLLDTTSGCIKLVRAGHPPPIFLPADPRAEIRELRANGLGIGLERAGDLFQENLETLEVFLQPEDMLLLYTDGVVEAAVRRDSGPENEEMAFYGEDKLLRRLARLRAQGENATAVLNALVADLTSFYDGHPQVDDYTLLVIQRTASSVE
ncbi:MAG: HAMP domain-containing protein, partial [Calditrichaeota bacterium]